MFGCGLPVPHGELVEWAVDAPSSCSEYSLMKHRLLLAILIDNSAELSVRKCTEAADRAEFNAVRCAPANGKDTRLESRNMHSREPLRIPRLEL
jgi:hypothetical protein